MLVRVVADGNAQCVSEGGLKGVEWAFNTVPGFRSVPDIMRPSSDAYKTVPFDDLPNDSFRVGTDRDHYETTRRMEVFAHDAGTPYVLEVSPQGGSTEYPLKAKYICKTGAVLQSERFRFLP